MYTRAPTSVVLEDLLGEACAEKVTLDWLMGRLGRRSFGLVLLLLGLLGMLPGVSAAAGVLLMIPALQMILGRPGPVFPRRVATRSFEVRRLARLIRRAVPVLRYLERFVHPRRAMPLDTSKRVVGSVVLLLGACLLVPVPLSNVPPALAVMLIAFAYLEEDGVMLCAALVLGLVMLAVAAGVAWEASSLTGWVPGLATTVTRADATNGSRRP